MKPWSCLAHGFLAPALRGLWQSYLRRQPVHHRCRRESNAYDRVAGIAPGRFDPRYDGERRNLGLNPLAPVKSRRGSLNLQKNEKARHMCLAFFRSITSARVVAPNGIQWPLIDSPEDALREGVVIRCFDLFGPRIIGRTGRDEDLGIGLYSGFSGGGWLLDFGRRDHRFL